jgi:hypothetical protein
VKLLGRLLLVFALLFAQAGAVSHEIWHATALSADGDAKTPKGNPLCDFHTALSAVLGAIHGGCGTVDAVAALDTAFISAGVTAPGFFLFASRSRGPPTLL